MPRTPPTTSYATRSLPTTEYERPRFFSSVDLCNSEGVLLTDVLWEQLISTWDAILTKKIITTYT